VIKLITLLKRGPHLSRDGFAERWLQIHAPKAAVFPGLRGYMLGFSVEPGEPAADGIAQLWFDSRAACQSSYASDIGREGSADAKAHLARRDHLLASEHWRRSGDSPSESSCKLVVGAKRPVGTDRAGFVAWFRDEALTEFCNESGAGNVRVSLDEAGQMLNSGTAGVLDLVEGEAVLDAMLELLFASDAEGREALARVRLDELPRLSAQVGHTETALLREHVVVPPPPSADGFPSGASP
jgi:uncharacterized protein (TIGR02118 family)